MFARMLLMMTAAGLLAAVVSSRWLPPVVCVLPGFGVFCMVPRVIQWHFRRLYELRFVHGNAQQALMELTLWKPLLDHRQYIVLRSGMLVEAGLFDSAARVLADPKVSADEKCNLRFQIHCEKKEWKEAEEVLRTGIPNANGVMQTCFRLDLARILAKAFPERLQEAWELHDLGRCGPIVKGSDSDLLVVEADLWLAGGDGAQARAILDAHVGHLAEAARTELHRLGSLARVYRNQGRAAWLEGEPDVAREKLLLARQTCAVASLVQEVEADLAALKNGEPLLPEPREAIQALLADRSREVLLQWPGGYGNI